LQRLCARQVDDDIGTPRILKTCVTRIQVFPCIDSIVTELPNNGRAFHQPQAREGSVALSPAQLSMLLEGIDWRAPLRTDRPTCAG
jgi:transposase